MSDPFSKMEYANDSVDANKLNAIYATNPSLFQIPEEAKDANSKDCSSSSHVDFLYLSTIRGGRKMSSERSSELIGGGCGCGAMKGGGGDSDDSGYTGGCFTCPKGVKNIVHIYGTLHIVIPPLYKKYKKYKGNTLKKVRA
jgi:hypothetical protein